MARYIDADKLHIQMEDLYEHHIEMGNYCADGAVADCLDMLDKAPTADVEEVRHGKWIEKFKDGFWYYDCPFCDDGYVVMERDENKPNYCHNCGAKMDGGKEDV